jgi:hypothetical protein
VRMRPRPIACLLWGCTFQLYNLAPSKSPNPAGSPTDTLSLCLSLLFLFSLRTLPPENSPDSLWCEVAAVSRLGEILLRFPLLCSPPVRLLFTFSKSAGEPTRAGEPLVELTSAHPELDRFRQPQDSSRYLQFLLNSALFRLI